jgi:hypothetical protein
MARRSVPLPKPKPPVLTVQQKRRRIDRLRKCIQRLETFDPHKVHKGGMSEVSILEADIDKALCLAFGYGTARYFRYILAATLDPNPLITNAALCSTVLLRPVGEPGGHDAQGGQGAQKYFCERSSALLRKAICTLEEIADSPAFVEPTQEATTVPAEGEVRTIDGGRLKGIDLKAVWHYLGRWWRGPN